MNIEQQLQNDISKALKSLFDEEGEVSLQPTRKDFEGTYTFVVFPLVKKLRKKPVEIGESLGNHLVESSALISGFNVVQGFLNLVLAESIWSDLFNAQLSESGTFEKKNSSVLVEFSSPNTNKPLHLGHLRNNFLGASVSEILKANGYDVSKVCLVNDRGIHICKSMIAYQLFGNGETPESAGIKGDHLAGKYYVKFDQAYKAEIADLMATGQTEDDAKKNAPLMKEAQAMLIKWENGDAEVMELWKKMNTWVYDGFNATYKQIGVSFDKTYYESDTYVLGKDIVDEGLEKGVFFKKEDNSVWIDLTDEGMDEKLVLRGDGTSVYITQDLGTTELKFKDYDSEKAIWVVGNEQDYHFKVLFAILKKLGRKYAEGCYHLSYGMVDLPTGKMKSREGTVVDADDLVAEMIATAKASTEEKGKVDSFTESEKEALFEMLALGALKYFLLKVEPKKRMQFNPAESIDFQGNTGPFIQYTHARIKSILRKAASENITTPTKIEAVEMASIETDLVYLLGEYKNSVDKAAADFAPSIVANYCYDLAKTFNSFYGELSVMNETDLAKRDFRLALIQQVAQTLKNGMKLLGIDVPERM
ncbi:arginine--tRNA ligase [Arcticibacterium luteifluviistationis]|uniref:Arginine--tRNA ligase n=1 Tax=Arcticibacterium luteifluviistationis TaxID=1784714 RepID=A0A2Z4GAR1_9BACT|nr:arginine--tRNA ligase [Arcticibacterium luteifluviistationis]AWV98168.1 arginine--tRNA ligase [Arcticibacterium luteifluviistationis]